MLLGDMMGGELIKGEFILLLFGGVMLLGLLEFEELWFLICGIENLLLYDLCE